jgi:hypothetical protein
MSLQATRSGSSLIAGAATMAFTRPVEDLTEPDRLPADTRSCPEPMPLHLAEHGRNESLRLLIKATREGAFLSSLPTLEIQLLQDGQQYSNARIEL